MKRPRAVLLVGLLAGTLAVRPQLTAVGPLLPEIQDDFGIDHATIQVEPEAFADETPRSICGGGCVSDS